jgi:hypothetical protein
MHLIYIDDSRDEKCCVFTALAIAVEDWRNSFGLIRVFRKHLKEAQGIFVHKEIHAWKLVSGRGRIADRVIGKYHRHQIFREHLELVARLPSAKLFNAVGAAKDDERIFEWMLNRIERTLKSWDSYGILICDEGKEVRYTRLVRRMGVFNYIPSRFGTWAGTREKSKNIPLERIVEDPVFKESHLSYFIQLVDCCAYSLLRREQPFDAGSKRAKYGLENTFSALDAILVREASSRDPEGIIRVK